MRADGADGDVAADLRDATTRLRRWQAQFGRSQLVAWSYGVLVTSSLWVLTAIYPGDSVDLALTNAPHVASSDALAALQVLLVVLAAVAFGETRLSRAESSARNSVDQQETAAYWLAQTALVAGLAAAVIGVWGAIGATVDGESAGARLGGALVVLVCSAFVVVVSGFVKIVVPAVVGLAVAQRRARDLEAFRAGILSRGGSETLGRRGPAGVWALLLVTPVQAALVGLGVCLLAAVAQVAGVQGEVPLLALAAAGLALLVTTVVGVGLLLGLWLARPRQWVALGVAMPALALVTVSVAVTTWKIDSFWGRIALLLPSVVFVLRIAITAVRGRRRPGTPEVSARAGRRLVSLDRSFELGCMLLFSMTPAVDESPAHPGRR